MLVYEYKLDAAPAQCARMDEAIRIAQFVRNKSLRLWMDVPGTSANDLQIQCSQLAKDFPFAALLNSQARQASADRAWVAISRFYARCRAKTSGKKGYPRFQRDNRSVEYKSTGWKLEPNGRHVTFTDGCGIGRVRLVGTRSIEAFPLDRIKRMRLVRRADGYYAQFCVEAERQLTHVPSGGQVGIDLGLKEFYTPSAGEPVHNPRFLRTAERRLKFLQRKVSRKSNWTKDHRKPGRNHQARKRQQRSRYPRPMAAEAVGSAGSAGTTPSVPRPASPPAPSAKRPQSHTYHKARTHLAKAHLHVQRQREDFARKQASALVKSCDLLAYEDLPIRNLVRNHHLAKSISDAAWGRFVRWLVYYAWLHGVPLIAVPPQYTTQACSGCGTQVQKTLSTRTHVCWHCGLILDRDENAARNILALALVRWEQGTSDRNSTAGQAGTGSG